MKRIASGLFFLACAVLMIWAGVTSPTAEYAQAFGEQAAEDARDGAAILIVASIPTFLCALHSFFGGEQ